MRSVLTLAHFFPLKTQYKALLTEAQPIKHAGRDIPDSFIPKLNLLRTKQKNVCWDLTSVVARVILTKVNVTLTTARFTLIGVQNKENPCNATQPNKAPNRSSFKGVTHNVALLLPGRGLLAAPAPTPGSGPKGF